MHIHHLATTTPWPAVSFGSWRSWDAYVAWPNLEAQKGKWDFTKLDKYVSMAEQNHVDILLPLALSPAWASSRPEEKSAYSPGNAAPPVNLDDWREYVQTVGTRYKGRIHEYEICNEPKLKDFYTGSVPQIFEITRIASTTLKHIDPSVVVCSPSATAKDGVGWLDQYLQEGGGKYADVIGYHFYVNPQAPENMVPLILQAEAVMERNGVRNKQIWNTETGWAIQNSQSVVEPAHDSTFNSIVLSTGDASAYLARAYVLNWAEGVSRLYWYAWDNGIMGLTEKDGITAKPPARAYAEVQKWLVGARMASCEPNQTRTWVCEITRDHGYRGWVVWNPDRSLDFQVPSDWHAQEARSLLSERQQLTKNRSIQIGQMPILLENGIQ